MKNIFIIGDVIGQYRTQNIIKAIQDNNKKYNIYFNNISLSGKIPERGVLNKFIRKLIVLFENVISIPHKIYYIMIADICILPAMNIYKQLEFTLISLIFNKIVITDYYVSFYDSLVLDRENVHPKSLKAKMLMLYDRNIIFNARKVLFLNSTEKDYYLQIAAIDIKLIDYSILPLCVDEKAKVNMSYYTKNKKAFEICWWGSYIPLHGLEKIIGAAELLVNENIDYKFFLFGNSEEKSKQYKDLVSSKDLESNVTIENDYTFANGKLNKFLISNCDLVLGNFGDSPKAHSVLVNKLVDGIAMKAPVLTGESRASEEFFDFNNDIWRCKNSSEDIARLIKEISNSSIEEVTRRVDNAYNIYLENFSEKAFRKKFLEIINEVK